MFLSPRWRSSITCRSLEPRGQALCIGHGGLQQILHVLRGALHRGEEISRPFDDVIAECAILAEKGVKEINLLGQNVNAYRGPMHDGTIADLALLIHYVAAIESVERVRFTTSHPVEFSQNLIDAYGEVPELANYLHLPVQTGSDRVLGLMKRGHTVLEYKQKIRRCAKNDRTSACHRILSSAFRGKQKRTLNRL